MNLSNSLTITRIVLIPLFIILLINQHTLLAMIFFGLASLTDAFDGIIARVMHQKTRLGFFLDPIADKLLLNTSFIALAIMGFIPQWLMIIVISRDILIVGGATAIFWVNETQIIAPTYLSKMTTTVQMLTVLIALINKVAGGISLIVWFSVWICAVVTIICGFDYVYIATSRMVNRQK